MLHHHEATSISEENKYREHIATVLDGDSDNFRFKQKAKSFGRIFRYMK